MQNRHTEMNPETISRSKITALLPTCNEEHNILECIASVSWVDEIFVVDSFSRDQTPELARNAGARVIQHEYINSAKQKNWGLRYCKYDWVFQIDSDETLEPGAEKIIRDGIEKKKNSTLHEFDEIRVIDGRFGPYIKLGKKNYKIPKGVEPEKLDELACQKIIAEAPHSKGNKGGKKRFIKKGTAA